MIRIYIFLFACLICVPRSASQFRLEFESFEEVQNDLSARTNVREDFNGDPAALLKIQLPILQDASISSSQKLGQEEYAPGEFRVYLCQGTKKITIKHSDFEPLEYIFPVPLKGKTVYRLVLRVPEDYISIGVISVKFNTNVLDAVLHIDGKEYQTDNGEFNFKLKKGRYPYTISTSMKGFLPISDNLLISENDIKEIGRIDQFVELQSEKRCNLHISSVNNARIKIDDIEIKDTKKSISLSLGRHYINVELAGYSKNFVVNLLNDNEYFDADICVPFTIVSPSLAEYTIQAIDNAIKPTQTKFKSGQTLRLLGKYKVKAKAKGYEDSEFEVIATPDVTTDEININVPMISSAKKIYFGIEHKQDIDKAIKEFKKQIKNGDEQAMWEYGNILINSGNLNDGNALIHRAANLNHPEAALYTGINIVGNQHTEKMKYLEIALRGGEIQAHEKLGDLYLNSNELKKAFEEYSKYNSSYSRIMRAKISFEHTDTINVEPTDIIDMLESIDNNDSYYNDAQNMLGEMAYRGFGMRYNIDSAINHWSNVPIQTLSQQALLIMTIRNLNNDNIERYAKEIKLSYYNTDFIISDGISLVQVLTNAAQLLDKKNLSISFSFLNKAFELGDRSLTTLSYLGKYYKDGTGVKRNEILAKEMLKMAVDQHNDVRSMRWLGNIYENEKDLATAELYYKRAISLNDPIAKGYYATLLFNRGKNNHVQAVNMWTEAAEAGHKQSIKNLITYYEKVSKNQSKADYWKSKL